MKHYFSLLILILCVAHLLSGQNVAIAPNPTLFGLCPNTGTPLTVTNNGCPFTLEKISGSGELSQTDGLWTINPADVSQDIVILYKNTGGSTSCPKDKEFKFPVLSIFTKAPEIKTCTTLVAGKSHTVEFMAELKYEKRGSQDPAEVKEYQWEILNPTSGWTLTTQDVGGIKNKKAIVTTNNGTSVEIRVRGFSHCATGASSNWKSCVITRFAESPCPLTGAPSLLLCEDTNPFLVNADFQPGLEGYTVEWTLPEGWTGVPQGNGILVTPNGINGGTITAVAKAFGLTSETCSITIPLEPIDPATKIVGLDFACPGEATDYELDITPPPSSSTKWIVTPAHAVLDHEGKGIKASLVADPAFNGFARIDFYIMTECGDRTRSKTFFVGTPKIKGIKVNGQNASNFVQICPNEGLGSHYVSVELEGDEDNCVDSWNDFGTTATNFGSCQTFDFTLQFNPLSNPPYNCVFLNVTSGNRCGTVSQNIIMCPSYWVCGERPYGLQVSPNPTPASNITVSLYFTQDGKKTLQKLNHIEILDQYGNQVKQKTEENEYIEMDISNLEDGIYYVRTIVEQNYVMEELVIKRD